MPVNKNPINNQNKNMDNIFTKAEEIVTKVVAEFEKKPIATTVSDMVFAVPRRVKG